MRQFADHRSNNFDFLRLFAAVAVLYSHCFPLSGTRYSHDPLDLLTKGQISFGKFGVMIFFLISGFLITQSYDHSQNLIKYFKARFLRIFPGLFVVLVISVFVLAPCVITIPRSQYFHDPTTYSYLKNIFLYPIQWNLPGIFQSNAYKGSVNGSLWTIPFEFLCYILVAILGVFNLHKSKSVAAGLVLFALLTDINFDQITGGLDPHFGRLSLREIIHASFPFICGMLYFSFRENIVYKPTYAAIAILSLFFAGTFGGLYFVGCLAGGYLLFYIAFHGPKVTHNFGKMGDFSYGFYLYAFPIQQLVIHLNGGTMAPYKILMLSVPVTFLFSIASWHAVEKRAQGLKKVQLLPSLKVFAVINGWASGAKAFLDRGKQLAARGSILLALALGLLASVEYSAYAELPTKIVFPYARSERIFTGGWVPQGEGEAYRWIRGSAHVLLLGSSADTRLIIKGFVPAEFTSVTSLKVEVNGSVLSTVSLSAQRNIDLAIPITIKDDNKELAVGLIFNDYFTPAPTAPDQRKMSALITRISLE
jgi:peptidoglycan/LPS O-acetylase OafA/YrhL